MLFTRHASLVLQTMENGEDLRISVKEKSSGTIVSGEDAPLASQLQQWLEDHPG